MDKTDLTFYRLPIHSDEWFRFRTTGLTQEDALKYKCNKYQGGVGASEIGCVLGLNMYRPVIPELYTFKVGTDIQIKKDNRSMLLGRILEQLVKDIWTLYDGDDVSWVQRWHEWKTAKPGLRKEVQIRKAKAENAYIVNKKYEWLFCSIDYYTEKNSFSLISGEKIPEGFVLEIKTINGYYANQWLNEIPAYHICQINQQMLITNTYYAELAILIDGRVFKCVPFERDERLCDQILEMSYEFWERVLKGRQAFKERNKALEKNNIEEFEKYQGIIDSYEPMPDNTVSFEGYMKEKYVKEQEKVKGSIQDFKTAKLYKAWGEVIKSAKDKQQFQKNKLLNIMLKEKAERIDFEDMGYVQGSPKFYNGIKEEIDKKTIEKEFNKIEL